MEIWPLNFWLYIQTSLRHAGFGLFDQCALWFWGCSAAFSLKSKGSFVPNRRQFFLSFFVGLLCCLPLQRGVKGWCSMWVLTGRHPFNVELCGCFFSGPKINASEGINRREKKAWTLGGQDCFVFPKAISLLTRRLLFQKNTSPATVPRSVGAQQSREHSRQTCFGKGAYLLPLKERGEEVRNLLCSAISALSTGFERAPVWQQKTASIYLR